MKKKTLLTLALVASLTTANAHSLWIVPSQTQLSKAGEWVTFDAAASNQMFVANHAYLDIEKMNAWSPSNEKVELKNAVEGEVRTTFDVQLNEQGTYQILRGGVSIFARGKRPEPPKSEQPKEEQAKEEQATGENANSTAETKPETKPETKTAAKPEKPKRSKWWRGSPSDYMQGKYPSGFDAEDFTTSVSQVETFVTLGAPTATVTAPSQYGLDIDYLTHPNDIVTSEVVTLRVMIDGKPAPDIEVEIIKGSSQYRNNLDPLKLTSNAEGEISVIWQKAGMYWLHAESEDNNGLTTNKKRRLSYSAVLEILPE